MTFHAWLDFTLWLAIILSWVANWYNARANKRHLANAKKFYDDALQVHLINIQQLMFIVSSGVRVPPELMQLPEVPDFPPDTPPEG